jgi:trigger factor
MSDTGDAYYKGIRIETGSDQGGNRASRESLEDAAVASVVQASNVEVPEEQLEETVSYMASAHFQHMKYDHMFAGRTYMPSPDESEEQMRLIREEAYQSIKTELVLKQIAAAEKLEVTHAELEEEATRIAERQGMSLTMVKDFLGEDLTSLRQDILLKKAADFVYQHAVFV